MPEVWRPDPFDDDDDEPIRKPDPDKPAGPFSGGGRLRMLAWGFSGLILTALIVILVVTIG